MKNIEHVAYSFFMQKAMFNETMKHSDEKMKLE